MPVIETVGLTKYYGKTKGIENVNLQVQEGEIFGFIGPNGAGKSTAIRTLLNFIFPTSGEARGFGLDVVRRSREIRAAGAVFCPPGLCGYRVSVSLVFCPQKSCLIGEHRPGPGLIFSKCHCFPLRGHAVPWLVISLQIHGCSRYCQQRRDQLDLCLGLVDSCCHDGGSDRDSLPKKGYCRMI